MRDDKNRDEWWSLRLWRLPGLSPIASWVAFWVNFAQDLQLARSGDVVQLKRRLAAAQVGAIGYSERVVIVHLLKRLGAIGVSELARARFARVLSPKWASFQSLISAWST